MMGDLARGGGVGDVLGEFLIAEVVVCLYCLSMRNERIPLYAGTDNLDFCTKDFRPELSLSVVDEP